MVIRSLLLNQREHRSSAAARAGPGRVWGVARRGRAFQPDESPRRRPPDRAGRPPGALLRATTPPMSFPQTRPTLIERLAAAGEERDWQEFLTDYWGPICRFAR